MWVQLRIKENGSKRTNVLQNKCKSYYNANILNASGGTLKFLSHLGSYALCKLHMHKYVQLNTS